MAERPEFSDNLFREIEALIRRDWPNVSVGAATLGESSLAVIAVFGDDPDDVRSAREVLSKDVHAHWERRFEAERRDPSRN